MKKIEILNFQNLQIEQAKNITQSFDQAKFGDEEALTVVVVRNPYEYFDGMLFEYLTREKSILFTQDIIDHMKELDNRSFLKWLDGLNFVPFQNPQTFYLDIRKRLSKAIENLESFDYVVPYEAVDAFVKMLAPNIHIVKPKEKKLLFSLSAFPEDPLTEKFIGKDNELYRRSLELWKVIEENGYKTLPQLVGKKRILERKKEEKQQKEQAKKMQSHKGVTGRISEKLIAGWVFHKEHSDAVSVEIYKNGIFLAMTKADKLRKDLKKQHIHPTGKCGFEIRFNEDTFKKGDKVVARVLPEKALLTFGEAAKSFLGM
ncbi:MAG TPA: hypothetical protein ENK77_02040 [Epsilonproteobacteria bacterium]|nr:hypothetical protein [Campylobacterota bacterium]